VLAQGYDNWGKGFLDSLIGYHYYYHLYDLIQEGFGHPWIF